MSKTKKQRVRSLIINLIMIAVAFGLLAIAIRQNREKIQEVMKRPLDVRLFALAFAIYLLGIILSFVRWYVLVRVVEPRFTRGAAIRLGFIGNVFNIVIPGAVGGDFIKAAYLVRMDINRTQAVASMVIDRILGLLGLFILAGVAGIFAWPYAPGSVKTLIIIVWAAVLCGLMVLAGIFNESLTSRFPALLEGDGRIAGILRELTVLSKTYRSRIRLIAVCLVCCSIIHMLFVVAYFILSMALFPDLKPGLAQHMLIVPLTLFTTAVPLPFGALGLTENVSGQLWDLVQHPDGAIAMMGFHVLMYAGGAVSAMVYLANIKQVRALTETAELLEEETIEGDLEERPLFEGDHEKND